MVNNSTKRKGLLKFVWLFAFQILCVMAKGQIIYAIVYNNDDNNEYLYAINLNTCEACPVTPPLNPPGFVTGLIMLPNGSHLYAGGFNLYRFEPPPGVGVVWSYNNPSMYWLCGTLAPNGLVYLGGETGLGSYNPANNDVQLIGSWPSGVAYVEHLFYLNGILYGLGYNQSGSEQYLIEINVTDPTQSVVLAGPQPLIPMGGALGGIWNGNDGIFHSVNFGFSITDIFFYDIQSGTSELICDLPNNLGFSDFSYLAPGGQHHNCLVICTTDAGTLPQAGPYNICTNSTLNFPAATGTVLDANDILRYILFSNPADTAGSIVATSSTTTFTFNPATMQTGLTYYIAAMAGNGVNGNVDLNDPCLDFSNALQVIWRPLPSVTFSVANPDVCAGGCTSVTATFTGTSPFTLTYTTPGSGPQTQTFSNNTGTFQTCVPAGAPAGSFQIAATKVVDVWCTCE